MSVNKGTYCTRLSIQHHCEFHIANFANSEKDNAFSFDYYYYLQFLTRQLNFNLLVWIKYLSKSNFKKRSGHLQD